MESMPCSRIGHIYRNFDRFKVDTLLKGVNVGQALNVNDIRVAEVWMDDYKKLFYDARGCVAVAKARPPPTPTPTPAPAQVSTRGRVPPARSIPRRPQSSSCARSCTGAGALGVSAAGIGGNEAPAVHTHAPRAALGGAKGLACCAHAHVSTPTPSHQHANACD